ncbi:MAG: hypothetical protein HYW71_02910 [Candidatus Niyogibacteria bacterium]|nr:hypothetical protein [Candidatus Niyogibacteria bacterium]
MENNQIDLDEGAWRWLFDNRTEIEIAMIINAVWLDPAYKINVLKFGKEIKINRKADGLFFRHFSSANKNSRHHRRPRSIGGKSGGQNVILVNRDDHWAWHKLFRNFRPDKIVEKINRKFLYLNSDYCFKLVYLADPEAGNGVDKESLFCCEICGESYFSEMEARKCRKQGWLAPRFACGERVLIKIKGCSPQIGTIAGWDNAFSINFHFYEMYLVETGNGVMKNVNAKKIKYVLKNNGRREKRKKHVVFSKKAFKKAIKRKKF